MRNRVVCKLHMLHIEVNHTFSDSDNIIAVVLWSDMLGDIHSG